MGSSVSTLPFLWRSWSPVRVAVRRTPADSGHVTMRRLCSSIVPGSLADGPSSARRFSLRVQPLLAPEASVKVSVRWDQGSAEADATGLTDRATPTLTPRKAPARSNL
jgi:hypothetical protein